MIRRPSFGRSMAIVCVAAGAMLGCDESDRGVNTTADNDFTLDLAVVDRFVQVDDEVPLTVRFRRTDNSNLRQGMRGEIVITTSSHGEVSVSRIVLEITDNITAEVVETLVFTARRPGIAKIRASFIDASAVVEVVISSIVN